MASILRYVPTSTLNLFLDHKPKPLLEDRHCQLRCGMPVLGYIGNNGSGKSLAAARDTVYAMEKWDRRALSNVRLLDEDGNDHPNWVPLKPGDWRSLVEFTGGEILLDEVQGVAGSRGHESLPPEVLSSMLQFRKRDIRLRWTTTTYARVDKALREVTQYIAICYSSHPDVREFARMVEQNPQLAGSPWVPRRMFRVSVLDTLAMESAEASLIATGGAASTLIAQEELATGIDVEKRWRRSRDRVLYETLGAIAPVADVHGSCLSCGGARVRPKCSCGVVHGGESEAQAKRADEAAPIVFAFDPTLNAGDQLARWAGIRASLDRVRNNDEGPTASNGEAFITGGLFSSVDNFDHISR